MGKGGRIGYSLCSFFSKVGLFEPDGLTSLALCWAESTSLFFCVGRPVGTYHSLVFLLDLEDLRTDSWCIAASISEKELKDTFSKNTLHSSVIP